MATSRCLAWLVTDARLENFLEGGPKFYPPLRCKELCVGSQDVCANHLRKRERPTTNKNRPASYWGVVSEPIRDFPDGKNYIAFGPWFMEKAKQFPLSMEKMRKLKTLHAAATEGVPQAPPVPEIESVPKNDSVPKNGTVPQKESVPQNESVMVAAPEPKKTKGKIKVVAALPKNEEKPLKKTKPKKGAITTFPELLPIALAEPLQIDEFVDIPVTAFEHGNTLYYLDSKSSKLYDRARDGSTKGKYKGRWDSVAETIVTTIPDSDAES